MFLKKNLLWFVVFAIVLFFFSQTFLFTWKTAAPYCRADDWRFIDIYLIPFFNGSIKLSDLWSDPVHPTPLYAFLFIANAKYSNLQIQQIAQIVIFFLLFSGILINYSYVESFKFNRKKRLLTVLEFISINTLIFSYIVHIKYSWALFMTQLYVSIFFTVLLSFLSDRYYLKSKEKEYKLLVYISLFYITSFILNIDWTVLFTFSVFTVFLVIYLIEKKNRRKILYLLITILMSLIISAILISFLKTNSRPLFTHIINKVVLLFENPVLYFESISIGQFSGLVNFKWFVSVLGFSKNLYFLLSITFFLSYLTVLVLFFVKKLYKKSIIPIVLMSYSLWFIISVLFFRFNPVSNGLYCLVIPRYAPYYQIGVLGFVWTLYLLLDYLFEKQRFKGLIKVISLLISVSLLFFWISVYFYQLKVSEYLVKSYHPRVSTILRNKLNNDTLILPTGVINTNKKKDITEQLEFLKEKKLNIFSHDYIYKDNRVEPNKKK